jgi:GNAT superfamily N-acetyltransferase
MDLTIHPATTSDIPEILQQRKQMYLDMGYADSPDLARMLTACEPFMREAIAAGTFRAWQARLGDQAAGGGAINITPWPAHPYDLECRRATILNVYVYPQFRRQGIARRLMQTMIDWCRHENFTAVYLHASDDGRHLYETLGFQVANEMKLTLSS